MKRYLKLSTKPLISLLLSLTLICTLATPALAVVKANPVDIAKNPHQQDILTIDGYGGLAGLVDQNGRFYPENPCSVSDLVRMMQNLYPKTKTPSGLNMSSVLSQKEATDLLTWYSTALGHKVTWSNSSSTISISRADAVSYIIGMLNCSPELIKLIKTDSGTPSTPSNPTIPTGKFADVPANAYYALAVDWAVDYGVTAGTSATTFSPDDTCTIAQVLTFLYRANGSPKPSNTSKYPFTNIQSDHWAYSAVRWAYGKNMISGDTNDLLSTPCTRAYLVSCLWQLAGKPQVSTSIQHFKDVPSNASYTSAVKWALSRGITSGTSVNSFSPFDTVNRAQVVTFLYRTYATN